MNDKSIDKLMINFTFLATFISIYMLNNNQSTQGYLLTKYINLIMTMIILYMTIISLYRSKKLSLKKYIYLIAMVVTTLLIVAIRKYLIFHWIYLIFILVYVKSDYKISLKIKRNVIYISLIFIVYQLSRNRFLGETPVLSWQDPNYSAYYLYMFFLYCKSINYKKISYLVLFLGVLTLSRTYLVAIGVYLLIENIDYIKKIIIKKKLNSFFLIMFISIILVVIIGKIFTNNTSNTIYYYNRGIDRLFSFNDMSNVHRFIANEKFIDTLLYNTKDLLFGMSLDEYTKSIYINAPHNAFFILIVNYGIIFGIIFLLIFGDVINKLFNKQNIAIILSQFIYFSLLGAGLQGFPGILLIFILKENTINKKWKEI